jgi:hypothetical protein
MNLIKKYWIFFVLIFVAAMFTKPELCFLIMGSLVAYIGFEAIVTLRRITKKGVECSGIIIEYEANRKGYKVPLIEFKTLSGELIREKPYVYSSTDLSKVRTYKNLINQPVLIVYDPDNPKKFVLTSDRRFNYIIFFSFFFGGLVFVILSIVALLGYLKLS